MKNKKINTKVTGRLMNVKDEDIDKILKNRVVLLPIFLGGRNSIYQIALIILE